MSSGVQHEPLVDTDVWIDYLRGHPQAVKCVQQLPERVWISAISVAELHAGAREGAEREALTQLLSTLEVVDLNKAIATRGALLRRDYGRSHGVGLNDALIGATALEMQLQLLTLNVKHYPELDKQHVKKAYAKS
ncbi:MAG: type II toxin-antitoxin system VapC family toxin [Polaromonas sp.]